MRRLLSATPTSWLTLGFGALTLFAEYGKYHYGHYGLADVALSGGSAALFFAAGALARQQLPRNPMWSLLMLAGVVISSEDLFLSGNRVVQTLGLLTQSASGPMLMHVALAFPSGRLRGWVDRTIVVVAWIGAVGLTGGAALLTDPRSLIHTTLALDFGRAPQLIELCCLLAIGGVLATRLGRTPGPLRRTTLPFYAIWLVVGWSAAVVDLCDLLNALFAVPIDRPQVFYDVSLAGPALVPVVIVVGLVNLRIARATIGERVLALGSEAQLRQVRDVLAHLLGDPSLRVLKLDGAEGYRDEQGLPCRPPDGAALTVVEHGGLSLGLLAHAAALAEDPELLKAGADAAGAALDARRVRAEMNQARIRVLEAGDVERRRVERALHDGAQPQLVALSVEVRRALEQLDGREPELAALLERLHRGLAESVAELRRLAQGSYPVALAEGGLDAALEALIERMPGHVRLRGAVDGRVDPQIAAAAYYVAAEGTANAIKHSAASRIEVQVAPAEADGVEISVTDDGVGGADIGGAGLGGLRERIEAHGGTLSVRSEAGSGTTVRALLPARVTVAT